MAPGDLVFGKPMLLQTKTGNTLFNPIDTKATLSKVSGGDDACIKLIRNEDGTVAIQSRCNKLYLTVDDDGYGEGMLCLFDGTEIEDEQKFRLELADRNAFIIKFATSGEQVEHIEDGIVCKRQLTDPISSSMLWTLKTLKDPAPSLPFAVGARAAAAAGVLGFLPRYDVINSSFAEDVLNQRYDAIMKMVIAGKSVQYIDDILSRLYGSTQ
ncbi:hypothetical protein KRP22_011625 [Phytophthora ramorum]|nr:hypothetical protein KRP22_10833 [Phytophthora ramorum]